MFIKEHMASCVCVFVCVCVCVRVMSSSSSPHVAICIGLSAFSSRESHREDTHTQSSQLLPCLDVSSPKIVLHYALGICLRCFKYRQLNWIYEVFLLELVILYEVYRNKKKKSHVCDVFSLS